MTQELAGRTNGKGLGRLANFERVRDGVYRRGKSYAIFIDLPRGPDGKRRQQMRTFPTEREAVRARRDLLVKADRGQHVDTTRDTVAMVLERWLAQYVDVSVRPKTAEGYRSTIKNRIVPFIGNIRITQLTDAHIKVMFRSLREEYQRQDRRAGPLSGYTLRNAYRILKKALNWAVRERLIAFNPVDFCDAPRVERIEIRTLNEGQTVRLLEAAAESAIGPLVHLAVFTGMRRSELLGLRWGDIDLSLAMVQVRRSLHALKGGEIRLEEPKSRYSRRKIDLPPMAVLALRRHREQLEAHAASLDAAIPAETPVFCRPDLTPMRPDSVSHQFERVTVKAGLGKLGLHVLRHTHASHLLRQGIHAKVVQERLGHSSIQVTLDLYSHVAPGMQEAAAQRFEAGLLAAGLQGPLLTHLEAPG